MVSFGWVGVEVSKRRRVVGGAAVVDEWGRLFRGDGRWLSFLPQRHRGTRRGFGGRLADSSVCVFVYLWWNHLEGVVTTGR